MAFQKGVNILARVLPSGVFRESGRNSQQFGPIVFGKRLPFASVREFRTNDQKPHPIRSRERIQVTAFRQFGTTAEQKRHCAPTPCFDIEIGEKLRNLPDPSRGDALVAEAALDTVLSLRLHVIPQNGENSVGFAQARQKTLRCRTVRVGCFEQFGKNEPGLHGANDIGNTIRELRLTAKKQPQIVIAAAREDIPVAPVRELGIFAEVFGPILR